MARLIQGRLPSQAVSGQQVVEAVMHGMHRLVTRACAVAAAGVVLGTWAVTAASASGGGSATIHRGAFGLTTATPTSNRYFAGYVATVRAGSATVSATSFIVPTLSCTTAERAITPVAGVDVNNYKTFSAAFVFTGCVNGTAVYFPSLVVNGTETDYTASPFAAGDVINLTTKVSTNRTRVQVTDVTTGVTQKLIKAGARAQAAYMGDSFWATSSGQLLHVPDFGKLKFKNCLIDGKTLASWHPKAYQRVNTIGTLQIATGAIWPTGTAFTTRFVHS